MAKNLAWYIDKYGEEEGISKHTEYRKNVGLSSVGKNTLVGFIKRYGEEEGTIRYESFKDKSLQSLPKYVERYGNEEGPIKYKLMVESKTKNFKGRKKYWIEQGYSQEEATLLVSKSQNTTSLISFIERDGEEEGTRKYLQLNAIKSFAASLAGFIQKYGETEGRIKYNHSCKSRGCTLENCIRLYGNNGAEIYNERKARMMENLTTYSKESIKYFIPLYKRLRKCGIKKDDIFWGIHPQGEYFLRDQENIYFFDFTIPKLKIIIEYNGQVFHPKEHQHDFISPYGILYEDAWNKDILKKELAINHDYTYIVIFSDELPTIDQLFNQLTGLLHDKLKK